jgi:hypothetical protein
MLRVRIALCASKNMRSLTICASRGGLPGTLPAPREHFTYTFSSTLSHVAERQPIDYAKGNVIHYVGLNSDGLLLYTRQWETDDSGANPVTSQDDLSGSLTFIGEPLVSHSFLYV